MEKPHPEPDSYKNGYSLWTLKKCRIAGFPEPEPESGTPLFKILINHICLLYCSRIYAQIAHIYTFKEQHLEKESIGDRETDISLSVVDLDLLSRLLKLF